jgi:pimeloyl-ACP methyl ester carboxylesterase
MTLKVSLNFLNTANASTNGSITLMNSAPYLNGVGDLNCLRTGDGMAGRQGTTYTTNTARLQGNFATTSLRGGTRTIQVLRAQDATAGSWANPRFSVYPNLGTAADSKLGSPVDRGTPLQQWSARFIIRVPSHTAGVTENIGMMRMYNGGTALAYDARSWRESSTSYYGWFGTTRTTNVNRIGGNLSSGGVYYRCEIQADNTLSAGSNNLALRLYQDDTTSLGGATIPTQQVASLTNSILADCSIDQLEFGDYVTFAGTNVWEYGEIQVWDTRNADGLMSNQWDALSGGVFYEDVSNAGAQNSAAVYSIPSGFTTPSDTVSGAPTYTEGSNLFTNYTYGSHIGADGSLGGAITGENLTIWKPSTTAPAAGHPLVVWLHGGFGAAGDKTASAAGGMNLSPNFRDRLTTNGWALCSGNYVRSTIRSGTTYSAYATNDTRLSGTTSPGYGTYQTMILNVKALIAYLKQSGIASAFGINPNKIVLAGGSYGAYLAIAAAITKGVTSDANGNNLTLAGNATQAAICATAVTNGTGTATYSGADPDVLGVLAIVPPNNIRFARDTDLAAGPILWPPQTADTTNIEASFGVSTAAAMAHMGIAQGSTAPTDTALDNTSLTSFAGLSTNLSQLKIMVMSGDADYLVNAAHYTATDTALAGAKTYSHITSPSNHDLAMNVMPWTSTVQPFIADAFADTLQGYGIPTQETFGQGTISTTAGGANQTLTGYAIPSQEQSGLGSISTTAPPANQTITGLGISTNEQSGLGVISIQIGAPQTITGYGISSLEQSGLGTISIPAPQTLSGLGIATLERVGLGAILPGGPFTQVGRIDPTLPSIPSLPSLGSPAKR